MKIYVMILSIELILLVSVLLILHYVPLTFSFCMYYIAHFNYTYYITDMYVLKSFIIILLVNIIFIIVDNIIVLPLQITKVYVWIARILSPLMLSYILFMIDSMVGINWKSLSIGLYYMVYHFVVNYPYIWIALSVFTALILVDSWFHGNRAYSFYVGLTTSAFNINSLASKKVNKFHLFSGLANPYATYIRNLWITSINLVFALAMLFFISYIYPDTGIQLNTSVYDFSWGFKLTWAIVILCFIVFLQLIALSISGLYMTINLRHLFTLVFPLFPGSVELNTLGNYLATVPQTFLKTVDKETVVEGIHERFFRFGRFIQLMLKLPLGILIIIWFLCLFLTTLSMLTEVLYSPLHGNGQIAFHDLVSHFLHEWDRYNMGFIGNFIHLLTSLEIIQPLVHNLPVSANSQYVAFGFIGHAYFEVGLIALSGATVFCLVHIKTLIPIIFL